MDCQDAREVLNNAHGFTANRKTISDQTMLLALEHVIECLDCKSWAKNEPCPKVKDGHDNGTLDADVYEFHGILHGDGPLEGDCVAHS